MPAETTPPRRPVRLALGAKRVLDVCLSVAALIVLVPAGLAVAVWIKLDSRGPVFFFQTRIGRAGKPFTLIKLRTMAVDAESRLDEVAHLNVHREERFFKAAADPRVTRAGSFLRRYSLDELPQLLNVLRGEMSLVGPRPLVVDEALHVRGEGRRRLDVRPGITGLWQVEGRNEIPFEEMLRLDCEYVERWSLASDLRLIARTVPAVLFQHQEAY
jgi:lipopolysaccharide/colanic/teichoic acid biosynthesis glycosyltransferase